MQKNHINQQKEHLQKKHISHGNGTGKHDKQQTTASHNFSQTGYFVALVRNITDAQCARTTKTVDIQSGGAYQ